MNWKFVAILSFALFAMTQVVGFASGLTIASDWTTYGSSIEEAVANATLVRRLVIAAIALPMYLAFFYGVRSSRLRNLAAVLVATGLFTLAFDVLMGNSFQQAIRWAISPTQICVGCLALAISTLAHRSNKTMQPTCEDARG